ncbi:hypothetical protein HPB50_005775 [Hyalomma asiaticum]|uniref:Uncharacterized protein n=1 Tax=Hyalomma asiaticum TaxID=266040 RepID=A0ACB7T782_HYAAI|nr:hypothetical protein HPB50_005775 [Hyalomma asiaticum]
MRRPGEVQVYSERASSSPLDAQVIVHDLCHVIKRSAFRLARGLPSLLPVFRRQAHSMPAVGSKPSRLPNAWYASHNSPSHPVLESWFSRGLDVLADTRARRRRQLGVGCVWEASAPAGHTGVDGRPLPRSAASSFPTPALTSVAVSRVRRTGDFLDACGDVAGLCGERPIFERGNSMRSGFMMSTVIGSNLHGGDGSRSGGNPRRLQRRLPICNGRGTQRFRMSWHYATHESSLSSDT